MSKKHSIQETKNKLGQYFSKNTDLLLHGFESYIQNKIVLDPFAGDYDLIHWALKHGASGYKAYDIEPRFEDCTHNDSLMNPLPMGDYFLLTNPPYLHKNKSKDKEPFDKWGWENLYKCHLASVIEQDVKEGLMVLPANFICEQNPRMRHLFFSKYSIERLVYWEDQILDDVSIALVCFYFRQSTSLQKTLPVLFLGTEDKTPRRRSRKPTGPPWLPLDLALTHKDLSLELELEPENLIGGLSFWEWLKPSKGLSLGGNLHTSIIVRLIDGFYKTTNNEDKIHPEWKYLYTKEFDSINTYQAGLYFNEGDLFINKGSTFSNYTLKLDMILSEEQQRSLVSYFNDKLNFYRGKYKSLFLPNYISPYQKILPQTLVNQMVYQCCMDLGFIQNNPGLSFD